MATLHLEANCTAFTAPPAMFDVPVAKMAECGPHWSSSWITFKEMELELETKVKEIRESSSTGPETFQLNSDESDFNHIRAEVKLRRFHEMKMYFDKLNFHPNQLLSKKYVTGTGLLVYHVLMKIKVTLNRLQRARDCNIIKDDPLTWLRGRLSMLISMDERGIFNLKLVISVFNLDPAMKSIWEQIQFHQRTCGKNGLSSGPISHLSQIESGAWPVDSIVTEGYSSVLAMRKAAKLSRRRKDAQGPFRGYFTSGRYGLLAAPFDKNNPPEVDPSNSPRKHNLSPRKEVDYFATDLACADRNLYRHFYTLHMFPRQFLERALNIDLTLDGCISTEQRLGFGQLVQNSGPVWILRSSTNLHLPHKLGTHGLILNSQRPMPIRETVPLFIEEEQGTAGTNCWYAGEYETEDAELFAPKSNEMKQDMLRWADYQAKIWNEGDKELSRQLRLVLGIKSEKIKGSDMYDSMLCKNGQPAYLPWYTRRLVFKSFDENFYQSLLSAHEYYTRGFLGMAAPKTL